MGPSTFKHNPSFSMRQMNFCLYVKNVSSHFTHSYLHFKYALQNCIIAVPYADKYDETMMKNYKRVSYSACIQYEWIIQKVESTSSLCEMNTPDLQLPLFLQAYTNDMWRHCETQMWSTCILHSFMLILMFAQIYRQFGAEEKKSTYLYPKIILSAI